MSQLETEFRELPTELEKISRLKNLKTTNMKREVKSWAHHLLQEMEMLEEGALDQRLRDNQVAGEHNIYAVIGSNFMDLVLIVTFIAFYFHERKNQQKMQASMATTLAKVEEVNHSLQTKLAGKDAAFKAAVHDLKNPIGSIISVVELLNDESGDQRSVVNYADIIQRISANTLSLVEATLDPARVATKSVIEIDSCLRETCAFLNSVADKKSQRIICDEQSFNFETSVTGARDRLQSVFYNLVGNALKFSPTHSSVRIETQFIGEVFEIRILDQGPGFLEADFSEVFNPGAKLSAKPTGGEHSSGFGLYSAKKAIDQLGGTLANQNCSGGGACILIRLPNRSQSKRFQSEGTASSKLAA